MIARLTAETTALRIGSGGVLLPYYSPFKVAETFRVLQALAPGRIDLGIGRGAGATTRDARLLNPALDNASDEAFAQQITAVQAFLGRPGDRDGIMPAVDGAAQVWLLGASSSSAALAGRLSLPYSFAHFGRPEVVAEAVRTYRQSFDPSGGGIPRVMVGIGVYCAPTRAEAQHIFASQRLFRQRMSQGDLRPVPDPETALAELRGRPEALVSERAEWPRYAVGSPTDVADQLTAMAAAIGVDEFVVLSTIHSHEDRVQSYALLAEALGVRPRPVPALQPL
jgi:luciferase family oxidoreductase group 1